MTNKIVMHPNFISYMEDIVKHPNYYGLEISRKKDNNLKWVTTKKTETGKNRIKWAIEKASELGFENSKKIYADVMLKIHPTKKKVCQCCGETMSLYYLYPTQSLVKLLNKEIGYIFDKYDTIFNILTKHKEDEKKILNILIKKAKMKELEHEYDMTKIIWLIEEQCRNNGKKIFSPGAMSNFPDRFDGFHSYNLCCRKDKDKGRNPKNMATYTKDRRAYEYWADGNIVAANSLMGNKDIFITDSADHIGPVSLGFIHDPHYIEPLSRSENSSKRDRLTNDSLDKIISIENSTNILPVSFFAKEIWHFIKDDYQNTNKIFNVEIYRQMLKENMINFMESLSFLLSSNKKVEIEKFFDEYYFKPKYNKYFKFKYLFDDTGKVIKSIPRKVSDANKKEYSRFIRISYDSIIDYKLKSDTNRLIKPSISPKNLKLLSDLRKNIENKDEKELIFNKINDYLYNIQNDVIKKYDTQE
ncbi:hypothetical protein K1Y24_06670 [Mammaliicoccus sciuri]|uniref:hypothetical protein n=1 Tax=Mammaliicoccus sciuri TaxID=1296 RepID=UPI001E50C2AD|nr:hypothetical protein [Mammaliicoccus sciuri]MCD8801641.1 hypothetical protein [Mammaliicoccus sciuri]